MKGQIIIISGFSGAGKGTIVNKLLQSSDDYEISISATTRAMRDDEIEGKSYFFVTKEKFNSMIANNEFLEYACYVNNYYGTPKKYVFDQLEKGKNVILEIEVQGALQIKKIYNDALLVFVLPPSAKELYHRLHKRKTETEEIIKDRLNRSLEEICFIDKYDLVVVNDDLDECVAKIKSVVERKITIDEEEKKSINNIINKYKEDVKGEKYV